MDSRIGQLIKRVMRYSGNMDMRVRRPWRMAIISLGCLAAAFLSGWSYYSLVLMGAALVLAVLMVYAWPSPRRRRAVRPRHKRPEP